MHGTPLVTIGLPVYNGAALLGEAIDSLLAQTFTDFELLISDNASTDATPELCAAAVRRDPRVRYVRQPRNIGAPANWNFVAREARGEFFKWASASDRCAPEFLAACLGPLRDDPGTALCYGKTAYIDEAGQPMTTKDTDVEALDDRPSDRFRRVCLALANNNEQYGLMRRAVLLKTRLDRPYPHGDLALMAELAMHGRFRLLPQTLLYRRLGGNFWTSSMSANAIAGMFYPGGAGPAEATHLRLHLDYLYSALSTPAPWRERLRAAEFALRYAWWKKHHFRRELVAAVRSQPAAKA